MGCNCHSLNEKKELSRRDVALGLASGSLLLVSGCATNEVTGRKQLIVVDDATLVTLSATAWSDLKTKTPVSKDAKLLNRVRNVGGKIAQISNIKNAQWEYEVFDSPTINAFVLPGGKVGVYKGLLDLVQNDAQLACVLGHETGHVSGRHAAERMSRGVVAEVGMTAAQIGAQKIPVSAGAQKDILTALGLGVQYGLILPFSREQELEADIIGLHYMKAAGYDPKESIKLWERMAQANKNKPPEWLSTHPSETTRIKRLSDEIAKMG